MAAMYNAVKKRENNHVWQVHLQYYRNMTVSIQHFDISYFGLKNCILIRN